VSPAVRVEAMGTPRLFHGLDRLQRLDLEAHRRCHRVPSRMAVRDMVKLAEDVDLRGRGGAAFPFAKKLTAVVLAAARTQQAPVVLVNATEGEPAASKDKALLTHVPHLVLSGAMLAVRALGARELVIGVTDEEVAGRSLRSAIAEVDRGGFIRVAQLPERFITGEGGALVRGVNGEVPIPPALKVRAAESGVGGVPTLLSNAETFAQLAILAELGPQGYRAAGTEEEPGTVLLTVTGTDGNHTVVETATGVRLLEVLRRCNTGVGQGVMVGGYHGAWLSAEAAKEVLVSRAAMKKAGAALGAGIIVPLATDTCPLGEVARVARYMGEESAGQCGPCRLGLPAVARSFTALAAGRSTDSALAAIHRGSGVVRGRGACSHPDGTTRFLLSALEVFKDDVEKHMRDGGCGRPVRGVLPVPGEEPDTSQNSETSGLHLRIDWSRCAGHGLCGKLLPDLIELDPFGYPVLTGGAIPTDRLRASAQAAEMCPALALAITAPAGRH
jgi:NADH:ubiquinone oxidoreductase subunit F (NADH-binding)/ferredoxin